MKIILRFFSYEIKTTVIRRKKLEILEVSFLTHFFHFFNYPLSALICLFFLFFKPFHATGDINLVF